MPSAREHDDHAASNFEFYGELDGAEAVRGDWAMVVLFYTAVHDTQALLRRKGWQVRHDGAFRYPKTHGERQQALKKNAPGVLTHYRQLRDWSESARYECEVFGKVGLTFAEGELGQLKAEIAKLG